ncbi:MAG: type II secretion system protein GspG [Armatimonadetes bacterium]|nr:type II secretion system protein GspG [Armatimonadota bacterium]
MQRVCDTNGSMSPRWTQKLMQLVSEWDGDRALIRLLQSERVVHLQSFNHLRATPKDAREFSLMWGEGCQIMRGGNLAGWVQPVLRQLAINELILLRFDRRLLEIARKGEPYDWNEFKPLDEMARRIKTFGFTFERLKFLRGFAFRPFAMAGELLIPSGLGVERNLPELAWLFEIIAKTKAHQRLLQTALALSQYRHKRGSYPATLSELVPNYLPYVPKDPFDGKTLRYRKEEQGFKLWSVGDDLTDDGGIKPKDITWSSALKTRNSD